MAEVISRFSELVSRVTLDNGHKVSFNLDTLRETKMDPKVGALILQEMHQIETIALFSDFCSPKESAVYYERHVV